MRLCSVIQSRLHCKRRDQAGFTLVELLITIAIMVIISTWAVPSYQRLAARNSLATEMMRIRIALALTRNTAITRHMTITLCPSTNEITCNSDDWTSPLLVVSGRGDDNMTKSDILKVLPKSKVEHVSFSREGWPIRYKSLGRPTGYNGTFNICIKEKEGAQIILSNFGRVRTTNTRPESC